MEKDFTALTDEYITPRGWKCLDATLFVYGNKPYLCFSNEWVAPITNDGDGSLYICENRTPEEHMQYFYWNKKHGEYYATQL